MSAMQTLRGCRFLPIMALTLGAIALIGCGKKQEPPDTAISQGIASFMPAYISVKSVVPEKIKQDENTYLVNWKATVTAKEDLYDTREDAQSVPISKITGDASIEDAAVLRSKLPEAIMRSPYAVEINKLLAEYANEPMFKELNLAQKQGQECVLYGHVTAKHMVDTWKMTEPVIESGYETIGKPRASFAQDFLVPDSEDAQKAMARYAERQTTIQANLKKVVDAFEAENAKKEQMEKQVNELREAENIEQRKALVELLLSGGTWEAESTGQYGNRLTQLEISKHKEDLFQVRFAVESRDKYTNCRFILTLGADENGVYARGPGNITKNGKDCPSTFELRPLDGKIKYDLLFDNRWKSDGILFRQ
ncbi:hypothetical protein JXA32_04230 [Candidatus Sumerlaeota bacterium]|nr:hypothetical protein [Candidatus Sumerlaeota bacterium]